MTPKTAPTRVRPRLLAALSGALLLGGGLLGPSAAASTAASPTKAAAAAVQPTATSIVGTWTLYYDWYCDGSYSHTPLTFYSNGTWRAGTGTHGRWDFVENTLLRNYDGSQTVYSGYAASRSATGVMTTFRTGANGCFFLAKGNLLSVQGQSTNAEPLNDAGKR